MNAVFELEVNSFPKLVRFCLSYIRRQIVPQNRPAVAEAIPIVIG